MKDIILESVTQYPINWLIILLIILFICRKIIKNRHHHNRFQSNRKIRKSILSSNFVSAKNFKRKWIVNQKQETGYKYHDRPGCYIITIYDKNPYGKWKNYKNIYVGQSINIYQRVHNHFTGKGKGDIYADIKNGKYVYVHFLFCSKRMMNWWEKKLIEAFHATDSYNATGGGAKRR